MKKEAFTLPELLIAVSIFSVVSLIVSGMYIRAFRTMGQVNRHTQIYEDARFIMAQIADEVKSGMIDYEEYFNQNVVIQAIPDGAPVSNPGPLNFGQNYGRYYSAFFNPGEDQRLGFACNDGGARNRRECTPLRRTIDRHTGENPFPGKTGGSDEDQDAENAMCATITYELGSSLNNLGLTPDGRQTCINNDTADLVEGSRHPELYIISRDALQKTILARERIGGTDVAPIYALSILRMEGLDTDNDGVPDSFRCAAGFRCNGPDDTGEQYNVTTLADPDPLVSNCAGIPSPRELPRSRAEELYAADTACDPDTRGFAEDFVPISPLRVNVRELTFYISPLENPYYAFAEPNVATQPRVTIVLTVEPNTERAETTERIAPLTLVETVTPHVLERVPAPLLVQ